MEELKEGWRRVKLGEVIEIEMGQSPKSEFYNNQGIGMPFLQGNRTFGDKYPYFDIYCTDNKKIALKKDVIMSVRAPVGDLNIATEDISIGRGVCALRAKNNQNQFLYYLLKYNVKNLINKESGTVFGSVNKNDILGLEIDYPKDIKVQEKIASILSALDDKIEINNEMNKTLEEMAQTLFKRWFIDFDFPNENGEPYRSSGGKMVDSELGEIPEGWKVGEIGDLIKIQNGYAFKSRDFLEKGTVGIIKIKNISDRKVDINKSDFISEELAEVIDKKFFIPSSSILIAMTGAEVGKIGIVPEHSKKIYLNQRVGKFEELINGGKEFSYFYLNKEETQELIIAKSAGSAQPNISSKGIEELKIVLPPIKLLNEFEKSIGKFLKKIALNLNEINNLTEIRDTLLPKLMSGEIEV